MNNSRLLFAAAASHCMMCPRSASEWSILFAIFLSLICFAAETTSGQEVELRRGTVYASGLAMCKAGLSALAAVMTERRLKHCQFTMMEANTLLKMQSLMVAFLVFTVQMLFLEDLCPEDKALVTAPCVDRRGWDKYTAFVLFAEVGNGWLSVAILARMSAIVKFVCKAAAAPSLYVVYVATNFRQHHFEVRRSTCASARARAPFSPQPLEPQTAADSRRIRSDLSHFVLSVLFNTCNISLSSCHFLVQGKYPM
ncbi:unnamed protein product [Symbiodinium necroappetens]|uniref:Uncharacterized protein n=1 Tax=Symbiodinium necroappetens TaxID=1628268 RepID=A0A812WT96_9DINO|nr:unnamed protein product [Symbiodinium necroappetens]